MLKWSQCRAVFVAVLMCSHTDVLVAVLKWSQYCAALVAALKCSYSDHLLLCRFGSCAEVVTVSCCFGSCADVLTQ